MKYYVAMYYNTSKVPIAQALIAAEDLDEAKSFVEAITGAQSAGVVELSPSLITASGVAMFETFKQEVEEDVFSMQLTTGGYQN